jgi:hypothetical protein
MISEGVVGRISVAVVLLVLGGILAFFTAPFVVQAFRGPRTISEAELGEMTTPGDWDNYVRYVPSLPAMDTGLRFGKKGNEGTKYVLLPVGGRGGRALFCSARVANNGPEYVGRLGSFGSNEEEAVRRIGGNQGQLMPFMLQAVRHIWVDSVAALVGLVACLGGAVWALLAARREATPRVRRPALPAD